MHTLEQEALDIFASQRYIYNCLFLFFRFIDDIIAIVSDYSTGFALMELLNSRRPNIKLSFKIRNMESQFLDLTLYKDHHESTTISVKAYCKPMNKFLFLPPTSCHPPHIFQGWIIGYGKRLRLNCSQDSEFEKSLSDFNSRLLQRGYEQQCITDAYSKIPSRDTILDTLRTTLDWCSPCPYLHTKYWTITTPIKDSTCIHRIGTLGSPFPSYIWEKIQLTTQLS